MTFEIRKSSDWDYRGEKTFNTLEELMEWIHGIAQDVIISYATNQIEIYDYWRE